MELKEFFVKRIGNIVASHGKAVADIDDYLPSKFAQIQFTASPHVPA